MHFSTHRAMGLILTTLIPAALATAIGAQVEALPCPAPVGSAQANLVRSADGTAWLSWVEPHERGHRLRFAAYEDNEWSEVRTIAAGKRWFVNWADLPSMLALPSGRLVAHWLVKSGRGTYDYDVHLAQSADGGVTWSESLIPHRDGVRAEHGFVSLLPAADDHTAVVWLDGREMKAQPPGPMTLRYAEVSASGAIRRSARLDERVCECCQTSAAAGPNGPLVVYRDRSHDEVRNIAITRCIDGKWTRPEPVCRDEWKIAGCPVNGPAIAASGAHVAVAWFTGADGRAQVRLARSDDGGASFAKPIVIDRGNPVGRVDVVVRANGDAWICWVGRSEGEGELRIRRVAADGKPSPPAVIAKVDTDRHAGFPQMVEVPGRLLLAYRNGGVTTSTYDLR